jgi:hypothetical protein
MGVYDRYYRGVALYYGWVGNPCEDSPHNGKGERCGRVMVDGADGPPCTYDDGPRCEATP